MQMFQRPNLFVLFFLITDYTYGYNPVITENLQNIGCLPSRNYDLREFIKRNVGDGLENEIDIIFDDKSLGAETSVEIKSSITALNRRRRNYKQHSMEIKISNCQESISTSEVDTLPDDLIFFEHASIAPKCLNQRNNDDSSCDDWFDSIKQKIKRLKDIDPNNIQAFGFQITGYTDQINDETLKSMVRSQCNETKNNKILNILNLCTSHRFKRECIRRGQVNQGCALSLERFRKKYLKALSKARAEKIKNLLIKKLSKEKDFHKLNKNDVKKLMADNKRLISLKSERTTIIAKFIRAIVSSPGEKFDVKSLSLKLIDKCLRKLLFNDKSDGTKCSTIKSNIGILNKELQQNLIKSFQSENRINEKWPMTYYSEIKTFGGSDSQVRINRGSDPKYTEISIKRGSSTTLGVNATRSPIQQIDGDSINVSCQMIKTTTPAIPERLKEAINRVKNPLVNFYEGCRLEPEFCKKLYRNNLNKDDCAKVNNRQKRILAGHTLSLLLATNFPKNTQKRCTYNNSNIRMNKSSYGNLSFSFKDETNGIGDVKCNIHGSTIEGRYKISTFDTFTPTTWKPLIDTTSNFERNCHCGAKVCSLKMVLQHLSKFIGKKPGTIIASEMAGEPSTGNKSRYTSRQPLNDFMQSRERFYQCQINDLINLQEIQDDVSEFSRTYLPDEETEPLETQNDGQSPAIER